MSGDEEHRTARRQRQLDELRSLCRSSATLARAIDLAFQHFAEFGRDDEIVHLLAEAVLSIDTPNEARRRFAELCAARH